jgi:Rps23 Pro-64 3,4-dihydroxylase Tpa1-like proline 4-hydroxylase
MTKNTESSIKATIPINLNKVLYLDVDKAKEFGHLYSEIYKKAEEYPHIVIDNFLPRWMIEEIYNEFPIEQNIKDKLFETIFTGMHKRQILPYWCEEKTQRIFNFFNSSPFIRFLESITSIDALLGDPHFGGGGFHEIKSGGHLGIHADFKIQTEIHLIRRINVLIYLNKNWKEEYGGNLELWNKTMTKKVRSIEPIFNRCVIFNTDSSSYHGHPDPLNTPENITRKSIALYYYTASKRVYEEFPTHSTMYKARPFDPKHTKIKALKLRVHNYFNDWLPPVAYRFFKNFMRFIRIIFRLNINKNE